MCSKLRLIKRKFMHFTTEAMCTRCEITLIGRKFKLWKKKSQNLSMWMPQSVMPNFPSGRCRCNMIADSRLKRQTRSFIGVDRVDTLFTLALVKDIPCG